MKRKIAIIGAGSLSFTRTLVKDILIVPELQDSTFCFMDINPRHLRMIAKLIRRDIAANGLSAKVMETMDLHQAVKDADYIANVARIGGIEAFKTDVEIPLKYGVDQCVGDTICIGGIMYGQRNIPAILGFCKAIKQFAKPDALFLNYANPNAMNTWAANHYGGVQTIGLCHGVQGGHLQIARVIESVINKGLRPTDKKYRKVERRDVDIICAGINHQTWYIQALYAGKDWAQSLLEGFEQHPEYSRTEKVRIDVMRRFGYYSTESNGHLSEYLPWYRKRTKEIRKWISMDSWIHGQTGGYLKNCIENRDYFSVEFAKIMKSEPYRYVPDFRSWEHGSYIIEAKETGRPYRGHFNVVNQDCITNLPADAIVEVPAYVDRNGIGIPRVGALPLGCAAICNASISVQRLAVEAAIKADVNLLKQAAMMDPLTGAVCTTEEISRMVDEMLVAQTRWLPQYKTAIERIRRTVKPKRKAK